MRCIRVITIVTIAVAFLCSSSSAMNLNKIFQEAITNNVTIIDQKENLKQAKEHYSQAVSVMLPNASGSFNILTPDQSTTKLSLSAIINIANASEETTDKLLIDLTYKSKEYINDDFAILLKDCTDDESKHR